MHKILFAATYPGFQQGGWAKQTSHMRNIWGLWLWKGTLGDRYQDSCAESLCHTRGAIFLGWSAPLHMASAWEKAIAPASGLPLTPP